MRVTPKHTDMQVFCKSYTGTNKKSFPETYSHFPITVFYLLLNSAWTPPLCFSAYSLSYPPPPNLHTCSISSLSFTSSSLLSSFCLHQRATFILPPLPVFQRFLLLPLPNYRTLYQSPNHTLPHLSSPSSSSPCSCCPAVIRVSLPNSSPFWITLRNKRKLPQVSVFPFFPFWLSDFMSPLPLCLTYFLPLMQRSTQWVEFKWSSYPEAAGAWAACVTAWGGMHVNDDVNEILKAF